MPGIWRRAPTVQPQCISIVGCVVHDILCGNNEPKRSCRYFAAFRVRIGCTFPNGFLVCFSLFGDRLWRRDEELWRYARARVGQGEEESDGCAEAHSARASCGSLT